MQIVSDLHLEFYKNPLDVKLKISAPYLAMLGDICVCGTSDINNLEVFLDYYSQKYKLIFWLPGNHEFYSGKKGSVLNMNQILEKCKLLCKKYKNVIFLNNKHLDIEINNTKYRLVGSTLWTSIPKDKYEYVIVNMNDYNHIYTEGKKHIGLISMPGNTRLTPDDVNVMHQKSTRYLHRTIKESPHPIIVFTHHKPFIGSEGDVKSKYYETIGYESDQISHLNDSMKNKIKIWGYGHTHRHFTGNVQGVNFISNPKGYPGQQTKFENNLIIL
jgi:hypothetical protein